MDTPEANVALFAFLIHYPWEFLQVPFFAGMSTAPHWDAVKFCTRAAVGDVGIALIAFWGTAAARSRHWICAPSRAATTTFVLIGLALTIVLERLATGPSERWAYSDRMPIVPALGVGLVPLRSGSCFRWRWSGWSDGSSPASPPRAAFNR